MNMETKCGLSRDYRKKREETEHRTCPRTVSGSHERTCGKGEDLKELKELSIPNASEGGCLRAFSPGEMPREAIPADTDRSLVSVL